MSTNSQLASATPNLIPGPAPRPPKAWRVTGLVVALLAAGDGLVLGQTGIPEMINYQGKITDTYGNPAKPGFYEGNFKIWSHLSSTEVGTYVWGRSFAFHVVTNGLFNVMLSDDGGQVDTP